MNVYDLFKDICGSEAGLFPLPETKRKTQSQKVSLGTKGLDIPGLTWGSLLPPYPSLVPQLHSERPRVFGGWGLALLMCSAESLLTCHLELIWGPDS